MKNCLKVHFLLDLIVSCNYQIFFIYNFTLEFRTVLMVVYFCLSFSFNLWMTLDTLIYSRQSFKRCYIFLLPWGSKSYTSKCWKTECKNYINKLYKSNLFPMMHFTDCIFIYTDTFFTIFVIFVSDCGILINRWVIPLV